MHKPTPKLPGAMELDGRRAVVTGGSSGIGRGIALALAEAGADVAIGDVREEPKLPEETETTVERVREMGQDTLFVECDVTEGDDAARLIDRAETALGGIEIVVNNAGILIEGSVDELSPAAWQRTFDVNATGVYHVCRASIPALRNAEHGRIINVASQLGLVGTDRAAAYCASKGAVSNLTRQMAIDYATDGITVNAINPGVIRTSMTVDGLADPDARAAVDEYTAVPFVGEPHDIGHAAVFLATPESRYVTGHCLVVDGGYTAQ